MAEGYVGFLYPGHRVGWNPDSDISYLSQRPTSPYHGHSSGTQPFDSPKHLFELKWDGMRALAFIEGGELKLLSRNARNITTQFPELGQMPELVKSDSVVLDGEIVCLDEQNRPSFSRLQQRLQSKRVSRPRINPAHFIAFDVLYVKGRSVMKEPLVQRKKRLNDVLEPTELIQACEFVDSEGEHVSLSERK